MTTVIQTPLAAQAVMTSGTAPSIGKFNIYNATGGSISATLPALSGLNVGARLSVGKYVGDSSTNTVTVSCAGSDKFQDGSTSSLILWLAGSQRELQVISVSSTKYWQIVGGVDAPTAIPVTTTNTVALTNKTLQSPTLNGTITGVADAPWPGSGGTKTVANISEGAIESSLWSCYDPSIHNDLAYNLTRGGTIAITKNGSPLTDGVEYTGSKFFDMGANDYYQAITLGATTDTLVITVTPWSNSRFVYGNTIGMFNGYGGPRDVTIEAYYNGGWATVYTVTGSSSYSHVKRYSSNSSYPVTQLRFTLTNFVNTTPRFYSIGMVWGFGGSTGTAFMRRNGGYVYGSTASPFTLTAAGSDSNVGINLVPKGTGTVQANSVDLVTVSGSQTLTNKTMTSFVGGQIKVGGWGNQLQVNVSSGNATVIASSDATNANLNLSGQGTGVVTVNSVEVMTASKTINAQTGTTYQLVLTDAGHLVTLSNGSAITLTVPANSSVAFPTGTTIDLAQLGAGQVTIAAAGGVTVSATPGLKIAAQYGGATLTKLATDTWLLVGDLAA